MAVVVVSRGARSVPPGLVRTLSDAGLAHRVLPLGGPVGEGAALLSGVEGVTVLEAPLGPPRHDSRWDGAGVAALVREALAVEVPLLILGAGTGAGADTELDIAGGVPGEAVGPAVRFREGPVGGRPMLPPQGEPADPLLADRDRTAPISTGGVPGQVLRIGVRAWDVRLPTRRGESASAPGTDAETTLDPGVETLLGRFADLIGARSAHASTRAFFTRRADDRERRFAYQEPVYARAVTRMALAPGSLALDLGCGTGRAMPALRKQVGAEGRVLGLDLTPAMPVEAARHGRTDHGGLVAADRNHLPLPTGIVHGIFSAGLLDHLPDPRAALREWARVTAPGGVLLLFHPSGRAERAARHHRPLDPDDLLAEPHLRVALHTTGWRVDAYEDAAHRFLARAVRGDS
ncbi:methyltransferase domain-containing protein [Streptomyces sp. NPDC097619]|uniref:class I SAM-dependent methyltransferase n=1 Tax=Streptomyces sp. NPDC097619 TaxID=3157228 RepID=UPI00331839EC